jgi:23S rRNA (cytidine1920-2'-O)/16S rRNA (cytidine1409-2'-O)-methyltransferase
LPFIPDLAVIDVSFISLKLVLPAVLRLIAPPTEIIALVKPQFEVGKGLVGKGGVVRDPVLRERSLADVLAAASRLGLECSRWIESPIAGAAGNREYLVWLRAPIDDRP